MPRKPDPTVVEKSSIASLNIAARSARVEELAEDVTQRENDEANAEQRSESGEQRGSFLSWLTGKGNRRPAVPLPIF